MLTKIQVFDVAGRFKNCRENDKIRLIKLIGKKLPVYTNLFNFSDFNFNFTLFPSKFCPLSRLGNP